MSSTDRRTKLIRLLAQIDQQICEAESLASDPLLNEADRKYAMAQLDFRLTAVERVEAMLSKLNGGEEPK
jgi:hypothetical protein